MVEIMVLVVAIIGIRAIYLWLVRGGIIYLAPLHNAVLLLELLRKYELENFQ